MKISQLLGASRALRVLALMLGMAVSAVIIGYDVPVLFSQMGEDE